MKKKQDNTQDIVEFMSYLNDKNPNEPEFQQAVKEVVEVLIPFINENPKYQNNKILERMTEPERIITFRVAWVDDSRNIQINRGYRIELNSAIGPYKGGLRFHPSVNQSILKFLGFEQVLKNALTGLPLGGGKGGSDFNPKEKSDNEIMTFCQAFMSELYRHIGHNTDIPAGDIGVGSKEIGYLFGQYKKLKNEFTGSLTGKSPGWGGSLIRTQATGYGNIYFVQNMLDTINEVLDNKTVVISGSGNVAQYTAEKALQSDAKVLTMSDSSGYIYIDGGLTTEILEFILDLKNNKRGRIKEVANKFKNVKFFADEKPWKVKADIVLPCATQNELDVEDAKIIVSNKTICISEGANMPCTIDAVNEFQKAKILFSPGKASNAGGVVVSGLEMVQNSVRYSWTSETVEEKLMEIMNNIHDLCVEYGTLKDGYIDYVKGSNIAGFVKVADAMIAQGVV
ncbi:MAG: NADP-specific glutamate dehydrogenase [Ichthyobacteriaceae bacterium]|nr:NADP-specific glutamate dehydrogenase [Ichthyobacteriaceae bacterium]